MTTPVSLIQQMRDHMDQLSRPQCACMHCTDWCEVMPGALAPGDLERIQTHVGDHSPEYVKQHFVASEGALISVRGQRRRVPSITPASRDDGACVFLDTNKRCSIHAVAPFGCSHFDCRMPLREADQRAQLLVLSQAHAMADETVSSIGHNYSATWQLLADAGRLAAPLSVRKARAQRRAEKRLAAENA